jgi:hypothetical protein
MMTREREILGCRETSMLTSDNVFDVKSEKSVVVLMDVAILAAIGCSISNKLSKSRIHTVRGRLRSCGGIG